MTNCRRCIYRSVCLAMVKPDDCAQYRAAGMVIPGMVGIHPVDKQGKFNFEEERGDVRGKMSTANRVRSLGA